MLNKTLFLFLYSFSALAQNNSPLVTVPVKINGNERGQVKVINAEGPENEVGAEGEKLAEIFRFEVEDKIVAKMESIYRNSGFIRIRELKSLGLPTTFSPSTLALEITVDAKKRKQQELDFYVNLPPQDYISPGWLSGYTNLYASRLFSTPHLFEKKDSQNSDPTVGRVEHIMNFGSLVLDASGDYTEFADYPWMRGNFRFIKDHESAAVRWIAGDFEFPLDMFQNSISLGGLLVVREFSIDPFLAQFPQSETEFYLGTPSKVDVFVNGRFMQTLYLPAGRHSLRNLPIQQGANDIKLVITDQVGKVRTLTFPFITDFELLDRGLNRFAYAYGRKKSQVGGTFDYGENAGSFYHQYGLTKNITVGVSGQGDDRQKVYGSRIYYGSRFGLIGINWAQSNSELNGTANAYSIRYRTLSDYRSVLRLQGIQINENYAALGVIAPSNPYDRLFVGSWTKYITDNVAVSIGGGYDFHRNNLGDRKSYFSNLSLRISRNTEGSIQYSEFRDPLNENGDRRLFVSLQIMDSNFENSFFASQDTQYQNTNLKIVHNPSRSVGRVFGDIDYLEGQSLKTYTAGLGYIGYRGIVEAEQRKLIDKEEVLPEKNQTRLTLSTAFAYTTKGAGLTRPIADSFALIRPNGALKGQYLEVNPTNKNPRAIADFWGPAIIPDLQSYYTDTLYVQTPDPKASSLLSQNTFVIRPTYKSGVGIALQGKLAVMLSGKLTSKDSTKNSLALVTGVIVPVGKTEIQKPFEFFTNKEGEFYLESIPPGEYDLKVDEQKQKYRFHVPEKMGPHDLGTIKF
ncbi:MAG: hypothetical protein A4S09_08210 [Proteobacteria bacterium SG_bin7]|nr:MAG: hypothetical protein A4S09_08210 [Proteobacteria bacterium SG_bin7]